MDIKSDSKNIFFRDPTKGKVSTKSIFEVSVEGEKLRVKNSLLNCLFSNLDVIKFDIVYNDYFEHLNLDFLPLEYEDKSYELSKNEQRYLVQRIITSKIYFYSMHGLEIKARQVDFEEPSILDPVLGILDEKYGIDTKVSLKLGAKILRMEEADYIVSVKSRRRFYDR